MRRVTGEKHPPDMEEHAEVAIDLLDADHAAAELRADEARDAVCRDEIVGSHSGLDRGRALADQCGHPRRVLRERHDLAPEPDVGIAEAARIIEQDRFQPILGAHGGRHGAQAARCGSIRDDQRLTGDLGEVSDVEAEATGSTGIACARTAASMPQLRRSSMVRVLKPVAFGCVDVPGCRSTSSEGTPWRDSRSDIASPVGPAPAIRTGIFMLVPAFFTGRIGEPLRQRVITR